MIPLGNTDFSSYLLSAKQSGAQVLGVLNAGADTVNTMKQVKQFGMDKSMKVAVGTALPLRRRRAARRLRRLAHHDVVVLERGQGCPRLGRSLHQARGRRTCARRTFRPPTIRRRCSGCKAVKAVGSVDADKVVALSRRTSVQRLLRASRRVAGARSSRDARDVRGRRHARRTRSRSRTRGSRSCRRSRRAAPSGPRDSPSARKTGSRGVARACSRKRR